MALSDLTNPDDPYRKSLESALYGRQADVINTRADEAQTNARENAFGRGVGFSSILPDYSTAPIERERMRALTSAQQNAFLGAGQEARANAATTNQSSQFAQSQAQQASQFNQSMANQRAQLAQNANQNLIANLAGGAGGLATLLLRPQGAGTSTLGGQFMNWAGDRAGQGIDWLSGLGGGASPEQMQSLQQVSMNLPNFAGAQGPGFGMSPSSSFDPAGLGVAAPNVNFSGLAGGGNGLESLDLTDPSVMDALAQLFAQYGGAQGYM